MWCVQVGVEELKCPKQIPDPIERLWEKGGGYYNRMRDVKKSPDWSDSHVSSKRHTPSLGYL